MKVFYHNGKNEYKMIDKNPIVSYETLESGRVIMWHDRTINSLIEKTL